MSLLQSAAESSDSFGSLELGLDVGKTTIGSETCYPSLNRVGLSQEEFNDLGLVVAIVSTNINLILQILDELTILL
jgi:hypothetical protein